MIGGADAIKFWLGQCPDKCSVLYYDGRNVLDYARDYQRIKFRAKFWCAGSFNFRSICMSTRANFA